MYTSRYPSIDDLFSKAAYYRNRGGQSALRESPESFRHFPYRERHLQCLWADPKLRPTELKSSEDEPVLVEHPGEWNLEAGPDFLNAALLVGREKRRIVGDLEIHISCNGWQQHGHSDDPRYENVRFHLVYFQGIEIQGLIQIPLQEICCSNPRFSFETIDTTAFPYSIPVGTHPLRTLHPDEKISWLESAGEERLRQKAERMAFAMQNRDPEQVLWEELLSALGYKNNKSPARRLAVLLPLARLRTLADHPGQAYALLLGLSGLLPVKTDPAWNTPTRTFVRKLWDIWWKQPSGMKESALDASSWTVSGLRPVNHPIRRLMAAAHYAFSIPELAANRRLLTELPANHWDTHINWRTSCRPTALVGASRANAIVSNILVPWRAATGASDLQMEDLPAEPVNGIIRQTAHALFGPDHTPKVYRSALARQGLIQVFHDYLVTHRLDELYSRFNKGAGCIN